MVHDEENLDQITGAVLKISAIDEPSAAFTDGVMQSIFALNAPPEKTLSGRLQYYWFLLLIPLVAAGVWYLSVNSDALTLLSKYASPIIVLFNSTITVFASFLNQIGNISVSPFILICGLAILFLLLIESFLSKRKYLQ